MKKDQLLFILILISAILVSMAGAVGRLDVYAKYDGDIAKESAVSLVMRGFHDGIYPWRVEGSGNEANEAYEKHDVNPVSANDAAENADEEKSVSENDPAVDKKKDEAEKTESVSDNGMSDNTISENDIGERSFTDVDDDYFSDALFVGDSRMEGLSRYVEPIDSRADFYTKTALTIYDIKDGKPVKTNVGSMSLWTLLEEKQYGKIYLMVGLNEIGTGDAEYFRKAYAEVVERIRQEQPEAIIFVNGIIHVSQLKSSTDPYFNNPKINERNAAIKTLADNKMIFYIDVNEALDDAGGNLRADITFDEIHLKGSCYDPWYNFLISHGVE